MNSENTLNKTDADGIVEKSSLLKESENSNQPKKQKLLSQLEQRLLSTKKYRQSWFVILGITILIFALSVVVLVYQFYPHTGSVKENMTLNSKFASASQILVYVSYGLMVCPFLYLMGSWISNINNISRSKYLHLVFWIVYSICVSLMLIAIILSFRSGMLPS